VEALGALLGSDIDDKRKVEIFEHLFASMTDENRWVRSSVSDALGTLAGSEVSVELKIGMVSPLITALRDKDEFVRHHVIKAMGALVESNIPMKDKVTLVKPLIERSLMESNWYARKDAAAILEKITGMEIDGELKAKINRALYRGGHRETKE